MLLSHGKGDLPVPPTDAGRGGHAVACTARQLALSWRVEMLLIGDAASTDEIAWFGVQAATRWASPPPATLFSSSPNRPPSPPHPHPTDTMRLVPVR